MNQALTLYLFGGLLFSMWFLSAVRRHHPFEPPGRIAGAAVMCVLFWLPLMLQAIKEGRRNG